MKLNGWIRLWIVLSAIWLITIGVRAYEDISLLLDRATYEVGKEGIGSASFVFSKSDPEDFVRRYINEELLPKVEKNPSAYVGKTTTTNYDTTVDKELTPKVMHYSLQAILPIFGVLALGWAFAWIRRGFSTKDAA